VRSGTVGVSCVVPEHLAEANCADLVIIKGPRGVLPDFGAYYINSVVETRVAAAKVGIALTHFNTQSVAALPVPVPPLAEQYRILAEADRRLSLAHNVYVQVESNLTRAAQIRQSVLQNAFVGRLMERTMHAA
jgi:type I restriction enzyme S subunit